jgi:N-acetylmuramoyl-L-alanine amidase
MGGRCGVGLQVVNRKREKLRVHQQVWKYFQQHRTASFQRKMGVMVVLGLLFLVITSVVNVQGAHAQSLCSSGDRTYVVVGGDTLSGIGVRYGVNWQQLASYNHIANPNLIYINQVVCIPGRGYPGTGNGSGSGSGRMVHITWAPSRHASVVTHVTKAPAPTHFVSTKPVNSAPAPTHLVSSGPVKITATSTSGNGPQANSGDPPKGTSNPFPYPYCTWWADQRFYQLHGFYVPWRINADAWQWTARAYQFGWTVSSKPTVGSIIDLQPGVEGAYGDGHVGVVEKILGNGHVIASNMNWGADPSEVVDVEFAPGPGVTFISY